MHEIQQPLVEEVAYFSDDSDTDFEAEAGGEADSDGTSTDSESNVDWLDTPQDGVFRFSPPSPPSKLRHELALDEEEDELPPFDEWYQDIARRAT